MSFSFKKDLEKIKKQGQYRVLNQYNHIDDVLLEKNHNKLISFSSNDYLGLSKHPTLIKAAIEATTKYGVGLASSRLVTGNNQLYEELERKISKLKNSEKSLVFGSGYLANIGTISCLVDKNDLVIADKYVHSCILDGVKISGAQLLRFKHNDTESCLNIIEKHRHKFNKCLIITETVFSMDGDVAPIDKLLKIANNNNALLMTDDAHGLGVLTPKKAHINMGTLSKAAGCYGGYVAADKAIIDYLINKARSLIFSTALPPSILASAIAAIDIITHNQDGRPVEKARYFTQKMGLPEAQSSIVPIIIGDNEKTLRISNLLEKKGFLVTAIRPPTVPKNTARLRLTFCANHKIADIDNLIYHIKSII